MERERVRGRWRESEWGRFKERVGLCAEITRVIGLWLRKGKRNAAAAAAAASPSVSLPSGSFMGGREGKSK